MVCAHRVGSSSPKDARKKNCCGARHAKPRSFLNAFCSNDSCIFRGGRGERRGNLWSCEVFSATSATSADQFFVLLLGRRAKLLAQILIGSRPQDKQSIQEAHGPSVDAPRRDGDESGGQREGPSDESVRVWLREQRRRAARVKKDDGLLWRDRSGSHVVDQSSHALSRVTGVEQNGFGPCEKPDGLGHSALGMP